LLSPLGSAGAALEAGLSVNAGSPVKAGRAPSRLARQTKESTTVWEGSDDDRVSLAP